MTGLVTTVLLFPIAGAILRPRSWSESYLYGAGLIGSLVFVLGLLHVPFLATIGVLFLAGLTALWFAHPPLPRFRLSLPTIALAVPLLALAIIVSITPLVDFDGRVFWVLKAKALAVERSVDGPFFRQESTYDARNTYPLLMPIDAAAVMIISGELDDQQIRWLYLLTFVAFVLEVRRRLELEFSWRVGAWSSACLAWLPQLAVNTEGGALSAYGDVAVGVFTGLSFFEAVEGVAPLRMAAWLSFLLLTKREGLPIACILLALAIVRNRRFAIAAPLPLITWGSLILWQSRIAPGDEETYASLLRTLPEQLDRITEIVVRSARHIFSLSEWGLFWWAVLLAIVFLAWRREWSRLALPCTLLLCMAAVYGSVFLMTNWGVEHMVERSIDRLLTHLIGPAVFLAAAAWHLADSEERRA